MKPFKNINTFTRILLVIVTLKLFGLSLWFMNQPNDSCFYIGFGIICFLCFALYNITSIYLNNKYPNK